MFVKSVPPGWRDSIDGWEDDVRPETERDGSSHVGGTEEAGHAQEVHGVASGNGLFKMQILITKNPDSDKAFFDGCSNSISDFKCFPNDSDSQPVFFL